MPKNAKQYRIERDDAKKRIAILEAERDHLTTALKSIGHAVIKGLS